MMLFPVLLSNLQRLSTAFEKKKNTQSAVFISILSDFNRARGETYAESIVERFAHNTTWIETGDVNMRQYLSHA